MVRTTTPLSALHLPALCLLAACSRAPSSSPSAPPARAVALAVDAGQERRAPDAASPATPPNAVSAPVGLSTFAPAPAPAVAKNARGVELLAKKDHAGAIRELEAALSLAPDFTLARYNLACARARAGDFARASQDLMAAFEADFVGMRAHAERDADLAELWTSDPGKELAARIPQLEARFQTVIERGVRAIIWRNSSLPGRETAKPSILRVGVYDPETGRFVAVAPYTPKAYLGFAASKVPYAIVATGTVADMLGGDMDPGKSLDAFVLYPMSTRGVPVATVPVEVQPYGRGTLSVGDQDALGTACGSMDVEGNVNGDKYCASYDVRFGSRPTRRTHGYAKEPPVHQPTRERPVVVDVGYNHWGYLVWESDASYSYKPFELTLPSGEKIAVPKDAAYYRNPPRSIVPSPSGDRVVLVFDAAASTCTGRVIPGHWKMALVETKTRKVTSLGDGDGSAHAQFAPNGDLYVQKGRRVFRLGADGETALPEGILLVPALLRADECGF